MAEKRRISASMSVRESRLTGVQLDPAATSLDQVPCEASPYDAWDDQPERLSDPSTVNLVAIIIVSTAVYDDLTTRSVCLQATLSEE